VQVLDFFFAARPMLHIPVWTIYLLCLHYHHELTGQVFDWCDLLMILALNLAFAGALYVNQVFDIASDAINRKLGFLENGMVTIRAMLWAFGCCSVAALLIAFWFSALAFGIMAQIVLLSYAYSAPPWRLKDRPFWSLFANAWAFGFLVPFTVMPELNFHNAGLLGWDNPFYFLAAVGGITALTMIPDRAGDSLTGKRTIAVTLGTRSTLTIAFLLLGIAGYVAYRSHFAPLFYLAGLAALFVAGAFVFYSERLILVAVKIPLLMMTLLAGFFYPAYLLFLVALIFATRIYYRKRFGILYPSLA
jgi:4-hydroxybenzoate polyprenyltransferase